MIEQLQQGAQPTPAHVSAMQLPVFKRSVQRSGMSPESFVQALTRTALSSLVTWSKLELETLLVAAERLGLNPLGREVFLVRDVDALDEPAVIVVGVDGWSRVLNAHKKFAGMEFRESEELIDGVPAWIECTLHRWDRRVPTRVREYLSEARGTSLAWLSHPRRMLRHKALVQCARLAFGLVGAYDHDEAQQVLESRRAERKGFPSKNSQSKGPKSAKDLGVRAVLARLDKQEG